MPSALPQPPQAVLIDLDGTLVHTLGDFAAALNAMARALELPPIAIADVEGFIGKGSEHLIRSTLLHLGAPSSLYPRAWDAYQSAYRRLNGQAAQVYPGVVDCLRELREAGVRLGCLTNKPGEFARELLRAKGLSRFFEVVFGGDAFERKKPDPLPLFKSCEALGTAPAATLMVGDSRNDAAAARAAGCPVVLVSYGYNHGEPIRDVDADAWIDSLADLPALLLRGR